MERTRHLSLLGSSPLELAWTLRTPASVETAWELFSNTHQMNQRLGMKIRYEQGFDDAGSPRRTAEWKTLGQTVRFEEDVFDYEVPRRIFIQRRFEEGPVLSYSLEIGIGEEAEGGSRVDYRIRWYPRNTLARIFVRLFFPWLYARPLQRVLGEIEATLQEEERNDTAEASAARRSLAEQIAPVAEKLSRPEIGTRLSDLLVHGSDEDLDRIQPLELAETWEFPPHELLDGFLEAVELGLLELRWELLCPSCQGPGASLQRLQSVEMEAHCESCNIQYAGAFADSLGVTFRPPSHLREVSSSRLCVGSPSWTPHILARVELKAWGEATWKLDLESGSYRIRFVDSLHGAHLEVRPDAGIRDLVLNVGDEDIAPLRLRGDPGSIQITVRSRRSMPSRIVLEKRWCPRETLTAGRLLERPRAQELLPEGILPHDLVCVVRSSGILVTEVLTDSSEQEGALRTFLDILSPTDLFSSGTVLYSTWDDLEQALDAAARLEGAGQLYSSVSHGPLLQLTLAGERQPAGRILEEAAGGLRGALPGRCMLTQRAKEHPMVSEQLRAETPLLALEPGPRFDERQDFLVEFLKPQPPPHLSPMDSPVPEIDGLAGEIISERYELAEELGSGGFGVVYGARDTTNDCPVVLKFLRPELFLGTESLQLFFREARAISILDDPGIVRFMDFGHDRCGRLYLVMERLHGRDLTALLEERGFLSPHRAVAIAEGVLDALTTIHGAGLLHRDIKPSNVFLEEGDADGEGIKLIDFGIVTQQEEVTQDDPNRSVIGTLNYMAPEQLQGEALGPATDLYAVGILLYVMLTGEVPYSDLAPLQAAFRRHRQGTLSLTEFLPDLPEALAAVVDCSLASDLEERFSDAKAMREALRAALD